MKEQDDFANAFPDECADCGFDEFTVEPKRCPACGEALCDICHEKSQRAGREGHCRECYEAGEL